MKTTLLLLALLAQSGPGAVPASGTGERPLASPIHSLLNCRAVSEPEKRLDCFDRSSGRLGEAIGREELTVVTRDQRQREGRSAFGLGPGRPAAQPERAEPLIPDRIESRVRTAREAEYGKWLLTLEDGSTWQTTEVETRLGTPRPGHAVAVRHGPLGAYYLAWDGNRELQAKRLR